MAIVTGNHDLPFGGINMVFAGDFAQLPPVVGHSTSGSTVALYSQPPENGNDERSIDHALWHQVTTVVILQKNIRQCTESNIDSKLRRALEHLRYKNCDKADLSFLESRRVNNTNATPDLTSTTF